MEHVIKMGKIIFGLIIATVHGHSQFNKSVIFIHMSLTCGSLGLHISVQL